MEEYVLNMFSKNSPEYISNGHYKVNETEYITIYSYRKAHGFGLGSPLENKELANNLVHVENRYIETEPDFGKFKCIKAYDVTILNEQIFEDLQEDSFE